MKANDTVELDGLARLLSASVGDEKASGAVRDAARRLGLTGPLSRDEALDVLEAVAEEGGIVGVTARFAKSRIHLAR
ncbi:MAG TPA: hypothetical protein RMH99_18940 [Sandaracinaceae bacterium LLY-WYZ-13_1]|nr:hypothetical protein [Sandaracinaceae bacterium LLY-WYZ-13_1]